MGTVDPTQENLQEGRQFDAVVQWVVHWVVHSEGKGETTLSAHKDLFVEEIDP